MKRSNPGSVWRTRGGFNRLKRCTVGMLCAVGALFNRSAGTLGLRHRAAVSFLLLGAASPGLVVVPLALKTPASLSIIHRTAMEVAPELISFVHHGSPWECRLHRSSGIATQSVAVCSYAGACGSQEAA